MAARNPKRPFQRAEDSVSVLVLALMSLLPLLEVIAREWLGGGIPGSIPLVQHMTMWISFLGAALAARSDRLLALSTAGFLPERWRAIVELATACLSVTITALLCVASFELVRVDRAYGDLAAWGVPIWIFTAVMPISFALITFRLIWHAGTAWSGRAIAASGLIVALIFLLVPALRDASLLWPLGVVIVAGTVFGLPIYAAIGGAALLLFWGEGTPISAVPGEAYRMSTSRSL